MKGTFKLLIAKDKNEIDEIIQGGGKIKIMECLFINMAASW